MAANAHDLTLGVEEEFLVVDDTGHLSYQGFQLAAQDDDDLAGEFQRELVRCQVETTTPVCQNAQDVLKQLTELRATAAARAAERGLRVLPSGTSVLPQDESPPITPGSRYLRMAEWFGEVGHTSNTCGCHVHVAIPDRATGVRISNIVRPWLPLLLALTSNSPFDDGGDTAYHSWRHVMWTRWPSAGPPPLFDSLDHYDSSVDALLRSGAMLDRGMVYWDIRLSEHQPTLEFRIADVAATAGGATLLAALIRGLVHVALDGHPVTKLPAEVLRANLWRAAREGLPGRCPHPVTGELLPCQDQLDDLVDLTHSALDSGGDLELVRAEIATLRAEGTGAQRQRSAFETRGRLTDVVDALVLSPA
jgi:carboxylate-amine ligase